MNIIKITNSSTGSIHFRLTYFFNGHLVSKSTPDFVPGHIGQLELPDNTSSIVLTVSIRTSGSRYKLICSESIYAPQNICYIVRGSSESAFCQQIPCNNFYNHFCCCNFNFYK